MYQTNTKTIRTINLIIISEIIVITVELYIYKLCLFIYKYRPVIVSGIACAPTREVPQVPNIRTRYMLTYQIT